MKKKMIALLTSMTLVLSTILMGCGSQKNTGETKEQQTEEESSETAQTSDKLPEKLKKMCIRDSLIGHHHTYDNIDGLDYQILVEADFLVNLYEDDAGNRAIDKAYKHIFKTETGKKIFRLMFGYEEED